MESLVDGGRGVKESFAELDLNLAASKLEGEEGEEEGEEREKERQEEEEEEEEKEKEPLVMREGCRNDSEASDALPLTTRLPSPREEEDEDEEKKEDGMVSPTKPQSPHHLLLPPSMLTEKKKVVAVERRRRSSPSPPPVAPPSRKVERAHHRERSRSASPLLERRPIVGREHHGRSRSRTPPRRDSRSSRYSPRGRHSPMRRSSPARYRTTRERSPRRRPWSPPRNRNTGIGKPGKNLFVAGFSFSTTERDLEKKFSRFGRVTEIRIVRDKRSGESRGFGFLSLETDEDADCAIRALDQTEWNGRVVLVEKAKTPGY